LKQQFTEEEIRFDHEPGEPISGLIVSEKFLDMEAKDRHAIIWNLLETHLTPEGRRQVLGFLAFTPWEDEARSEDLAFAY
jgi:hypothetical protein